MRNFPFNTGDLVEIRSRDQPAHALYEANPDHGLVLRKTTHILLAYGGDMSGSSIDIVRVLMLGDVYLLTSDSTAMVDGDMLAQTLDCDSSTVVDRFRFSAISSELEVDHSVD